METITIQVLAMYGDHHVLEVRRILLEMPGIKQVNASSCFQIVEITYDPSQLDANTIQAALDEHGYLQELPAPLEFDTSSPENNSSSPFLRHTTAYEGTQQVISFAQTVADSGRPLWPCPGFGSIRRMDENAKEKANP